MQLSNQWVKQISLTVAGIAVSFSALAAPQAIEPPHETPLLTNLKTLDIFKQGIYHFNENQESYFQIGKRLGSSYQLKTRFSKGTPHQFSYGGNRDLIVVNGRIQKPSAIRQLRATGNNQVSIQGHQRDKLLVSLVAYDISDKPIHSFLKTQTNRPSQVAQKMATGYRFSKGAVAYVPTFQSATDKVVIPNKDIFTGQKNLNAFVKTFSGKIPTCLGYERRSGSQPYAIRFVNNKGNHGNIEIYEAKRSTVFCEAVGNRVAMGKYHIKTVNGTKIMSLSFPNHIDSRDVGIKSSERDAVNFAFVELQSPKRQVLPGLVIEKGKNFHDFQYRFNAKAAEDIRKAMR